MFFLISICCRLNNFMPMTTFIGSVPYFIQILSTRKFTISWSHGLLFWSFVLIVSGKYISYISKENYVIIDKVYKWFWETPLRYIIDSNILTRYLSLCVEDLRWFLIRLIAFLSGSFDFIFSSHNRHAYTCSIFFIVLCWISITYSSPKRYKMTMIKHKM